VPGEGRLLRLPSLCTPALLNAGEPRHGGLAVANRIRFLHTLDKGCLENLLDIGWVADTMGKERQQTPVIMEKCFHDGGGLFPF
jgi:hypothetical protein